MAAALSGAISTGGRRPGARRRSMPASADAAPYSAAATTVSTWRRRAAAPPRTLPSACRTRHLQTTGATILAALCAVERRCRGARKRRGWRRTGGVWHLLQASRRRPGRRSWTGGPDGDAAGGGRPHLPANAVGRRGRSPPDICARLVEHQVGERRLPHREDLRVHADVVLVGDGSSRSIGLSADVVGVRVRGVAQVSCRVGRASSRLGVQTGGDRRSSLRSVEGGEIDLSAANMWPSTPPPIATINCRWFARLSVGSGWSGTDRGGPEARRRLGGGAGGRPAAVRRHQESTQPGPGLRLNTPFGQCVVCVPRRPRGGRLRRRAPTVRGAYLALTQAALIEGRVLTHGRWPRRRSAAARLWQKLATNRRSRASRDRRHKRSGAPPGWTVLTPPRYCVVCGCCRSAEPCASRARRTRSVERAPTVLPRTRGGRSRSASPSWPG